MPTYHLPSKCDDISKFNVRLGAKFPNRIVGVSSPPLTIITMDDFTPSELGIVEDICRSFETLDSWESSKFRNLTLTQINNEVASLDAEIDAAGNLATAKVVLKKILVDNAKVWRIILWLLKREMNQLDGS